MYQVTIKRSLWSWWPSHCVGMALAADTARAPVAWNKHISHITWKVQGDHLISCMASGFFNAIGSAQQTSLEDQQVNTTILQHMGVSKNNGTPKSSILMGFSITNHPFLGTPVPLFLGWHPCNTFTYTNWTLNPRGLLEGTWHQSLKRPPWPGCQGFDRWIVFWERILDQTSKTPENLIEFVEFLRLLQNLHFWEWRRCKSKCNVWLENLLLPRSGRFGSAAVRISSADANQEQALSQDWSV